MSFVTQERVFERHLIVTRVKAHGRGKLIARGGCFAYLQKRVGEILTDGGTVRRKGDGALEALDSAVVVLSLQGLVSSVQFCICRIYNGLAKRGNGKSQEYDFFLH